MGWGAVRATQSGVDTEEECWDSQTLRAGGAFGDVSGPCLAAALGRGWVSGWLDLNQVSLHSMASWTGVLHEARAIAAYPRGHSWQVGHDSQPLDG